ncbi:MAG: peptidoglycan-binding domain-containing protein [Acidimicrobiales bacterium]
MGEDESPQPGREVNRSRAVGISLVALALAAGVGWMAGRQVRSPAEIAAGTLPPTPSLITVPVESRRLTSDVVTRGAVGFGTPTEVSLPASTLKQSTGIVTVPPVAGAVLAEGSVALAISARPVLIFHGDTPAYRDITLKTAGQDVRQLEAALFRLGFDPGPQDGLFDNRTLNGARNLYAKAGYELVKNTLAADELLFFPNAPIRVKESMIKAGETPSGPVMSVTGSKLTVGGELPADEAKLVKAGAAVAIEETDSGVRVEGSVQEVATTPGTNGVDPQRFYVAVEPKELPPSLVGATVVLTIVVQSTEAEVLAVPLAALAAAADGTTRVEVQVPGSTRFVTVRPGLVAKGLVAVTPVDGLLAPGDLVVVGIGPASRPGSAGTTTPSSTLSPSTTIASTSPSSTPGGPSAP